MRRVSVNLAVVGVAFSAVGTVALLETYRRFIGGDRVDVPLLALATFLSLISSVILFVVYRQWIACLNESARRTLELMERLNFPVPDEKIALVPSWSYTLFVIFWALSLLFPQLGIFALLQLVFFVIFLHHLFTAQHKLQEMKNKLLFELTGHDYKIEVFRTRNVLTAFLLALLTLGVYWLYLTVRISKEINDFMEKDEITSGNLEVRR